MVKNGLRFSISAFLIEICAFAARNGFLVRLEKEKQGWIELRNPKYPKKEKVIMWRNRG
jgi:hypothetical protein